MSDITQKITLAYIAQDMATGVANRIRGANDRMASSAVSAYQRMAVAARATAAASLTIAASAVAAVSSLSLVSASAANSIDSVIKRAQAFGVEVNTWNNLTYAADKFGASVEGIGVAFKTMMRNLGKGKMSEEVKMAFSSLGIDLADVVGKKPEEAFLRIADAIKNAKDQTAALSAAQTILGEQATDLMPFLQQGLEGIRSAMQTGARFQIFIDPEVEKRVGRMKDAMLAMKTAWSSMWQKVGVSVMNQAATIAEFMSEKFRDVGDYLRALGDTLLNLLGGYEDGARSLGASIYEMIKNVFQTIVTGLDSFAKVYLKIWDSLFRGIAESLSFVGGLTGNQALIDAGNAMADVDTLGTYNRMKGSITDFFDQVDQQFKVYQKQSERMANAAVAMADYIVTERGLKGVSYFDNYPQNAGALGLGGSVGGFTYSAQMFGDSQVIQQQEQQKKMADNIEEIKVQIQKQDEQPPAWFSDIQRQIGFDLR